MKKYFVGLLIGLVFLAYSFDLRHQHSAPVVIAPSSPTSSGSAGSNTSTTPDRQSTTAPPQQTTPTPTQTYKDGSYVGSVANAYYGNVQVSVDISSGKIDQVNFLQAPNENPNSIYVNSQAKPALAQEAVKAQNANVSIVTGATFTSQAFIQSLTNALSQAK